VSNRMSMRDFFMPLPWASRAHGILYYAVGAAGRKILRVAIWDRLVGALTGRPGWSNS